MSLLSSILSLRKEAPEAVAELDLTDLQKEIHVPTLLEDELERAIRHAVEHQQSSDKVDLFVITGNAGDGKTDLMARVRQRVGDAPGILWNEDLTHTDTGTAEHVARTGEFLREFQDGKTTKPDGTRVVAANVGMLLWLFEEFRNRSFRFSCLEDKILAQLGLSVEGVGERVAFRTLVVNLNDRPGILVYGTGGFIRRLLHRAASHFADRLHDRPCKGCPAGRCFVRSNLKVLSRADVLDAVEDRLRLAVLEERVHLTAREVLDFFSKMVAGPDLGLFQGHADPCDAIRNLERIAVSSPEGKRQTGAALCHLVFPNTAFSANPANRVALALSKSDPALCEGPCVTDLLVNTYNEPATAAEILRFAAGKAGTETAYEVIASYLEEKGDPLQDQERQLVAWTAVRIAYFFKPPQVPVQDFHDEVAHAYCEILEAYTRLAESPGAVSRDVAERMESLRRTAVSGIRRVFGSPDAPPGGDFIAAAALRPGREHQVLVETDNLDEHVRVVPDPKTGKGPFHAALEYQPLVLSVQVRVDANTALEVPVDLRLYRLLRMAEEGFNAPSFDLEGFYALRSACEALATRARGARVLLRVPDGAFFEVRRTSDAFGNPQTQVRRL